MTRTNHRRNSDGGDQGRIVRQSQSHVRSGWPSSVPHCTVNSSLRQTTNADGDHHHRPHYL